MHQIERRQKIPISLCDARQNCGKYKGNLVLDIVGGKSTRKIAHCSSGAKPDEHTQSKAKAKNLDRKIELFFEKRHRVHTHTSYTRALSECNYETNSSIVSNQSIRIKSPGCVCRLCQRSSIIVETISHLNQTIGAKTSKEHISYASNICHPFIIIILHFIELFPTASRRRQQQQPKKKIVTRHYNGN